MTQKDTQNPASRIIELDALRGIAAVAVLVCHLPRGFWFGETGVDLFFVLSGFLITGIILRNLDQPAFLRTFYWRRILRIFPIYYLALLAVYSVNAFRSNPEDTTGFPFYLAYLQRLHGYWGGNFPVIPSLAHTWTLAIEEQFYIFWPFALVLSRRRLALGLPGCSSSCRLPYATWDYHGRSCSDTPMAWRWAQCWHGSCSRPRERARRGKGHGTLESP